jgi:hypothetical protein
MAKVYRIKGLAFLRVLVLNLLVSSMNVQFQPRIGINTTVQGYRVARSQRQRMPKILVAGWVRS